jgi:gas vesicle protein
MENENNKKMIGALLIGVAIGGVLGVLFTSGKGSKITKMLIAKAGNLNESLKTTISALIETASEELSASNGKAHALPPATEKKNNNIQ